MEALKCEACGGELALDAEHDLYLCEYCGSRFPRKKARVEMPQVTVSLSGAGILPADRLIQNGRTMLELGDYAKAREIFGQAAQYYPEDYRGWWHIFLCDTKGLTAVVPDKDALYKTKELEYALRTAPKDVQPDLLRQYRDFAGQCMKMGCEMELVALINECRKIDEEILAQETAAAACLKKGKLVIKNKKVVEVVSVLFMIPMLLSLARPSLWLILAVPLGLFGILSFAATKKSPLNEMNVRQAESHARERDRLVELKRGKQEYMERLQRYMQALPMTMERLTIADIFNQKKYIA